MAPRLLDYVASGPADAPLVVLVHGWPDDAALWSHFGWTQRLGERRRCVAVTLPGFGDAAQCARDSAWGVPMVEVASRLEATIEHLLATHPRAGTADAPRRVSMVQHDWGCLIGYIVEHRRPELIERVVSLDVGAHSTPASLGVVGLLITVLYQWTLIVAFLLPAALGSALCRLVAHVFKAPAYGSPTRVHSGMCQYYWHLWTCYLLRRRRFAHQRGLWAPDAPTLFALGTRKPFQFASPRWCDALAARTDGSAVLRVACGHWVQADPGLLDATVRFLDGERVTSGALPRASSKAKY